LAIFENKFTVMRKSFITLISALILASVVFSQDTGKVRADKLWESEKVFQIPESVFYDHQNKVLYVSNINGNPTVEDENGFISRVGLDGKVIDLQWVQGLNAPKGMGKIGNVLYVTDITRLIEIDIPTGRILHIHDVEGAKFLNDITTDPQGYVYISDMQAGVIYRYDGKSIENWMEGEILVSPNGLYLKDNVLYIGCTDRIIKVDTKTGDHKISFEGTGSIDGLNVDMHGNYIISNWRGLVQFIQPPDLKIILFNTSDKLVNAADIFFAPSTGILYVPTFADGRVMAYKIVYNE